MLLAGESPWARIAESEAWKKPRCSLQDPATGGLPARPRRLNVLGRQPGCSLQDGRYAASDRVDAAAGGCEWRPRDGCASSSSDSRDGPRATFGGCRGPLRRTRSRFGAYVAGNRCASAPGIPAGCTPPGRGAAGKVERLAGNTGSSVAGKPFPPGFVSGPTLRKSDLSKRCRVSYRVLTASTPMGCHTSGAAGSGQKRLKWRHFSPALTFAIWAVVRAVCPKAMGRISNDANIDFNNSATPCHRQRLGGAVSDTDVSYCTLLPHHPTWRWLPPSMPMAATGNGSTGLPGKLKKQERRSPKYPASWRRSEILPALSGMR